MRHRFLLHGGGDLFGHRQVTGGRLLAPDSRPYPHLADGTDTIPQIDHVVILMMENHSFDDHFGMLGRGDGLTLDADGRR